MIAKTRRKDQDNDGEEDRGRQHALLGFRRVNVWDRD
jgi:hypothetical protein